jgi:hypothetical protein
VQLWIERQPDVPTPGGSACPQTSTPALRCVKAIPLTSQAWQNHRAALTSRWSGPPLRRTLAVLSTPAAKRILPFSPTECDRAKDCSMSPLNASPLERPARPHSTTPFTRADSSGSPSDASRSPGFNVRPKTFAAETSAAETFAAENLASPCERLLCRGAPTPKADAKPKY